MATHHVNITRKEPLQVSEKDLVVVHLEANPTTGCRWFITELNSDEIKLLSKNYFPSDGDSMGSGGIEVLNFVVLKKSQGLIHFIYKQPWNDEIYNAFTLEYQ